MADPVGHITGRQLRMPRAAAFAGVIFAFLFACSYFMIFRWAPEERGDLAVWLARHGQTASLGVGLLPFAGIAFIWFMAVLRDTIGYFEDQFFSTLFLGSGFLYLALTFMGAATAHGALSIFALDPELATRDASFEIARAISAQSMTLYAMRMAGMFALVLGTIWMRTALMPRWLVICTYVTALTLLFSLGYNRWLVMVFPCWVFVVSIVVLLRNYRQSGRDDPAA